LGAAGHPYASFQRALKRRNVLMAVAAARDLPQLSLLDALELTVLVARKDLGVTSGWRPAGCCATSRRILTRRSTKPCWPRRASSRSPVLPTRRPRRRYGPWPKERLAGGREHPQHASAGRDRSALAGFRAPSRARTQRASVTSSPSELGPIRRPA
jgi:hypothetical protein